MTVRCCLLLPYSWGHPHGNAFVCKCTCFASFWPIIQMDPVNALFWNLVSGWKHLKTPPLRSHVDGESAYFAYWWHHRPIPRPLAFNLLTPWHLITTTTTTMADYMLVFVLQKILSLLELVGQSVMLLCNYAEQKSHCTSHFHLPLVVFGFSFYCLFVYSTSFLANLKSLSRLQWIHLDANILQPKPRKTGGKKIVLVRVEMALERTRSKNQTEFHPTAGVFIIPVHCCCCCTLSAF